MTVHPPILAILGATASGKSELALRIAEQVGGEILSVDSMQVYKKMDIGTAKPTSEEQSRVKHHLIDLVDPNETFTVARFVELADAAIKDAAARNIPIIAVGGTPLYYKALFEGMFEGPGESAELRLRLRGLSNEELHERLAKVDPAAATRIHQNDTRRLIRALEVHELTGKPISSFQTEWTEPTQRHQAKWFGIEWDRELLNRRINARVKLMLEAGWLEETKTLLSEYKTLSKTAGEAAGYRELIDHLEGKSTLEEATEQIKINTRQLARRQIKWIRRFPNVTWLNGQTTIEEKITAVLSRWKTSNE